MEEYLENPKTDEEFYKLMKEKRENISSLSISEDEKNNLYSLIDMNIKNYEILKKRDIKKNLEKITELFSEIGNTFIEIKQQTEKNNRALHLARINQQITDYKIKKTREQLEYTIKRERGKIEARRILKVTWAKMVEANRDDNQNN